MLKTNGSLKIIIRYKHNNTIFLQDRRVLDKEKIITGIIYKY